MLTTACLLIGALLLSPQQAPSGGAERLIDVPVFSIEANKVQYLVGETVDLTFILTNTSARVLKGTLNVGLDDGYLKIWVTRNGQPRTRFVTARMAGSSLADIVIIPSELAPKKRKVSVAR